NPINMDGPFMVGDFLIRPIEQQHGRGTSWGFRVGDVAYCPDVNNFPPASFEMLEGLDVWIIDCLRDKPHPSHAHLAQVLTWVERLKPKRTILTHMSHELEFSDLAGRLPEGVEPAVDGMVLDI
ncbi:MAG: MBL fold metallo-hydrolase, partial [Geminicoccaceae bacterium]